MVNKQAPVAQWIEQDGSNVEAGGSNPPGRAKRLVILKILMAERISGLEGDDCYYFPDALSFEEALHLCVEPDPIKPEKVRWFRLSERPTFDAVQRSALDTTGLALYKEGTTVVGGIYNTDNIYVAMRIRGCKLGGSILDPFIKPPVLPANS